MFLPPAFGRQILHGERAALLVPVQYVHSNICDLLGEKVPKVGR